MFIAAFVLRFILSSSPFPYSSFSMKEHAKLLLLEQQSLVARGRKPQCNKLMGEMCKPCPKGGPVEWCNNMKEQCSAFFCDPFCKKSTWRCKLSLNGPLMSDGKDEAINTAVCSEFIAQGCSKILKCCPENEQLYAFVENGVYQDQFPEPLLPSPFCKHDTTDLALGNQKCNACKNSQSSIKIEVAEECPFPEPTSKSSKGKKGRKGFKKKSKRRSKFLELSTSMNAIQHEPTGRTIEIPVHFKGILENAALLEQESSRPRKGIQLRSPFPGLPVYANLQDRCTRVLQIVKSKKTTLEKEFQRNLCSCLGCCPGGCPYPVTIDLLQSPQKRLGFEKFIRSK